MLTAKVHTPTSAILFSVALMSVAPAVGHAATYGHHPDPSSGWAGTNTTYFADDFEGGLGSWDVQCTWAVTQTTSRSATHSLTDSPSGMYEPSADCAATLADPLDLSTATDPVLVFWHKGDINYWDGANVEASSDGGLTWTQLRSFGSTWRAATWSREQVDLGAWIGNQFKVRFRLTSDTSNGEGDGWYIDDVEVREKDTQRLTYPFADNFENGLGNWIVSGHDWALIDATARSETYCITDSPTGDYPAYTYCSATLAHPIDLSEATHPVLTFWHKGDINYHDGAAIEVSRDGGTTWSQLRSYGSTWRASTWSMERLDLQEWIGSEFQLRFRLGADATNGEGDGWYIDDVRIEEKDTQRLAYPFADDFENGLGSWIVSGRDWALIDATARSETHCITDSPGVDYPAYSYCSATLAHPIDLSGATHPVLTFWHKGDINYHDGAEIEASRDGGTTWSQLRFYGSTWRTATWFMDQLDLQEWIGDDFRLRFRLGADATNGEGDGWYIDDVRIEEKDTQRLAYPFADNFENGLGSWIVSGRDWALIDATARSETHCITDSPAGEYPAYSYCSATLAHPIDLSGATHPVLTYWHRGDINYWDGASVEASSDGGLTWSHLRSYGSTWRASTWSMEQLDLQEWIGSEFQLRFRLGADATNGEGDGWYIDDVRIEEKDTQRLAYPFADNFENGLGSWVVSGHDWALIDSTARTGTHCITDSPAGDYPAYTHCSATLVHPIDLSGATHPVLTFFHKGDINYWDGGQVEVSTDGGTSWTTIRSYGSRWQQTGWSPVSPYLPAEGSGELVDLQDWLSSEFRLRFRMGADATNGEGDGWYIDDVRIQEIDDMTGVADGEFGQPRAVTGLKTIHPNPFNATTTIMFTLPEAQCVRLEIYDTAGRRVRMLANEQQPAGQHEIRWDGTGDDGRTLASGMYVCRLEAGTFRETRRMALVK